MHAGALSLVGCSLHVITAATHCFDLDLLNTVVQDNINPIERVEASGLIMASTIFQRCVVWAQDCCCHAFLLKRCQSRFLLCYGVCSDDVARSSSAPRMLVREPETQRIEALQLSDSQAN